MKNYFAKIFVLLFIIIALIGVNNAKALTVKTDKDQDKTLIIKENHNTLYGLSNEIEVSTNQLGDVYLAASKVTIKKGVTFAKSLVIFAGDVVIEDSVAENAVTIFATDINIKGGSFRNDILVVGSNIKIDNIVVAGDIAAAGTKLEMTNSKVAGSLKYAVDGELKNFDTTQVNGGLKKSQLAELMYKNNESFKNLDTRLFTVWFVIVPLSIMLLIAYLNMKRRGVLNTSTKFDFDLLKYFGIGLGVLFGSILVGVGLLFISLGSLTVPVLAIWGLVGLLLLAAVTTLPIYLASIINTYYKGVPFGVLTLVCFILVSIITVGSIPIAGGAVFWFTMMNFGSMVAKLWSLAAGVLPDTKNNIEKQTV
jgi:hypothetical protein